jgi:hypothetical protein
MIACLLVGTFKNTLLIFGSDHGARFGAFRGTSLGRMEERLPLQLLVFPEWFKNEYKEIYEMLQVIFLANLLYQCKTSAGNR